MKQFDNIFVISRKSDTCRLELFFKQFEDLGLDWKINVFTGIEEEPPKWYGMSKGFWGCQRSHRELWQKLKDNDWKDILIFEDDAKLCNGFVEKYNNLKVPHVWDMLYLGGRPIDTNMYPIEDGLYKCNDINLMHAYAINKKCIKNFLEFYDTHWFRPTKKYLYQINDWKAGQYHKNINAYLCLPNLVSQREGFSSTENRYYRERFYGVQN